VALGLFAGTPIGARVAMSMPPSLLQRGFAIFLVVVAVRMWLKAG